MRWKSCSCHFEWTTIWTFYISFVNNIDTYNRSKSREIFHSSLFLWNYKYLVMLFCRIHYLRNLKKVQTVTKFDGKTFSVCLVCHVFEVLWSKLNVVFYIHVRIVTHFQNTLIIIYLKKSRSTSWDAVSYSTSKLAPIKSKNKTRRRKIRKVIHLLTMYLFLHLKYISFDRVKR